VKVFARLGQRCVSRKIKRVGGTPALQKPTKHSARLMANADKGVGLTEFSEGDKNMKLLRRYGSAMRSLSVSVALLALAALAPGAARAQQITTTKVIFFVTDPSGAAIGSATIVLGMPSNTPGTKTDEYGRLSVDLPIGAQYNFPVSAPGYISDYIYIDLTSADLPADDTKNVTVVLHPGDGDSQNSLNSQTVPKSKLLVTGDANHAPLNLSFAEFRALPHVDVKVHNGHSNTDETYSGVPLAVLLAKVGAPLEENLRGKALTNYVVATGSDGYSVVLSLAEVDPTFHEGQIVVADSRDGQPLATSGTYQLIVTEDKRPARWVENLVSIAVQSAH